MRQRGQVFTLDMLFALILVASFVGVSTQALNIASGQTRNFTSRYSMERVASDAADVLVDSSGTPPDWEGQTENLEVPGLAVLRGNTSESVPNRINFYKLWQLRELMRDNNWDPSRSEVQAVKKLFGGTNNFEIEVLRNENVLMRFWPRWDTENSSGVEKSLEVAAVDRIGYGTLVDVRDESDPLVRETGQDADNLEFMIYEGELENFDWYLYTENLVRLEKNYSIDAFINRSTGTSDYTFHKNDISIPGYAPEQENGIENDSDVDNQLQVGFNYISLKFTAVPGVNYIKFYVIAIPTQASDDEISDRVADKPIRIRVKVWR